MSKQTKCPKCKNSGAYCIDTRTKNTRLPMDNKKTMVKRTRYKCMNCNHRWSMSQVPSEYLDSLKGMTRHLSNILIGKI